MSFDDGATLAERMRAHAGDSGHLYGELMRAMADDWDAGGPVRDICRGWETAPARTVVQLRLLAGLFRIVLTERAPDLVPYYPCLGGTAPPDQAWPAVREVLGRHVDELHTALDVAPQTNEVGRSTALLVGVFEAVRRSGLTKVRLLEPGASAGLNLLVDRFRFEGEGWAFGPVDSPLVMRDCFAGTVEPSAFTVVERRGCDLAPVDPNRAEGALRLRSFVWPFHLERHDRLVHALALARHNPATVDRAGASAWLASQLARQPDEDVLTIVWHSITQMYWPGEESAAVDATLAAAMRRMPLGRVAMEYAAGAAAARPLVSLGGLAPDGSPDPDPVTLGSVGDHGVPLTVG